MSNLEIISKLTEGTQNTQEVKIEKNENEGTFTMRPLTSGELAKIRALEKKGFMINVEVDPKGKRQKATPNTGVDVNAGEFDEHQTKAMYTAISLSLNTDGEKVPIEALEKLPVGFPEELFKKVIEISNLSDKDLTIIKKFRKNE